MGGTAQGQFVWYDLMTTDPGAAKKFYTQLVGWGVQAWDGPAPYDMWTNGDAPIGGVMRLPEEASNAGAPPHWLAYVNTSDIDATVRAAQSAGGTLMVPPTEIPGTGRFAVLSDPQGAMFALYSSERESPAPPAEPPVGTFSWHELATSDYEAGFEFYSSLFGWEKIEALDMGPGGMYQMYGQAGNTYGGMFNKPADMPGPPGWMLYINLDDVSTAADRVTELGGQVVNGPMEVPGGDMIAHCVDPQGGFFAIHSKAPTPAD